MDIIEANIDQLEDLIPLFDGYRKFYKQESDTIGARQFLTERLKNKDSIIFLAFNGQNAIGFTQLYHLFSSVSMQPMLLLNDLFIKNSERNKGVGEALIKKAKERAIATNQKGLLIQTETTNRAQVLYKRLGFKEDPDLHMFWKNEDAS